MKIFRNFGFGLFAVCLFVAASTLPSFARGSGQSGSGQNQAQADEHAGYQGIPVRNGLNRGAIQQADISDSERYPRLPRRPNETAIDFSQSAFVDADQDRNQNEDRAGYRGIPQSSSSNRQDVQSDNNPDARTVESAGYRGIPQRVATGEMQPVNAFAAQRSSALVNPK